MKIQDYTIGRLAKKFNLSRSTLLYYDRIGLLSPSSGHLKGEYRYYTEKDSTRLARICGYRKAGISLANIKAILDSHEGGAGKILSRRFEELEEQIAGFRDQQRFIANILQSEELLSRTEPLTKQVWTALLTGAGYSEEDMVNWHIRFERSAPERHLAFLRHLNIPEEEIIAIRRWAEET